VSDSPGKPNAKKVFIRTFGCQMNDYDSDKMADVLRAAEGYEATLDVEQADLILFNTCSVREKAQEKVFSDLGRVKHLKKKGVVIGVGGCVASQEGAAIIERAPYVDIVFGPQTLHRLPQMIAARRSEGRPQVDISFPEIEKFDHLPPARVEGASAFVSIMEGCSKYCSYCVVPYTRGEEVSRPFEDVLTEVAGLAEQGVKEVTLLGQNVNAYRGAMGGTAEIADFALLIEYVAGIPGHRAHPLHHQPPQRIHAAADRCLRQGAAAREPPAPAGAARQRPHPDGHEAGLHGDGIQEHHPQAARGAAGHQPEQRLHRRLPRRNRRRLRQDDEADRPTSATTASFSFVFSPRPGTPAAALQDDTPQALKLQRLQHLQATIEDNVRRISASRLGTLQRILVEGPSRNSGKLGKAGSGAQELMGRTECNRIVNFDGGPQGSRLVGQMLDVRITEALPHSLRGTPVLHERDLSAAPAQTPATTA
jgi:tRNA-2-methylthio-N6-dimethylallyladenosine synthase